METGTFRGGFRDQGVEMVRLGVGLGIRGWRWYFRGGFRDQGVEMVCLGVGLGIRGWRWYV